MIQVGRYQVLEELGRGATGIVYKALDPAIGRTVAIKTIDLAELTNPDERQRVRERLLREAQSAGLLSHPNIVTIYDVLEKEDCAYIFMEYVNGASLEKMLRGGSLPEKTDLLQFLRQVADALDYAHRKGIVHRDIKPANIIISAETPHAGQIAKIADFGVAKFISHEVTHSGTMIGTPNYMSPEQIQGLNIDGRSDQFSLAVIVYELLSGAKPFSGENLPALFYQICKQDPRPIEQVNETINDAVARVLYRALSKVPHERFPTCIAFISALIVALDSCPAWVSVPRVTAAGKNALEETSAGVAAAVSALPAPPRAAAPVAVVRPTAPTRVRKPEPAGTPGPSYELPPLPKRRRDEQEIEAEEAPRGSSFGKKLLLIFAMCFAIGAAIVFIVRWNSGPTVPVQVLDTKSSSATPPDVSEPLPMVEPSAKPKPAPPPVLRPATKPETISPPHSAPQGTTDVEFLTAPAGASIVIDGNSELACTTPCTLSLPFGRHTLAAQVNGYDVSRRIFNVPDDRSLYVEMGKDNGVLEVTSQPSGATILVDGKDSGKTPATLHLTLGPHQVTWVYEGTQHQETVEIQSGIQARGYRFQ